MHTTVSAFLMYKYVKQILATYLYALLIHAFSNRCHTVYVKCCACVCLARSNSAPISEPLEGLKIREASSNVVVVAPVLGMINLSAMAP